MNLITIIGSYLKKVTAVSIGNIKAIPIFNDDSTLKIMVMPGTVGGKVSIVTSGGRADSAANFDVIAAGLPWGIITLSSPLRQSHFSQKKTFTNY